MRDTTTPAGIAGLASLGLAAAAVLPAQAAVTMLPEDRLEGAQTIRIDDLRAWLGKLASRELAGRGTGSEGFAKAAKLVAAHFEELGLEPAGDAKSYLQRVPWKRVGADRAKTALTVRAGQRTVVELRPGSGLHGTASTSARASGEVVLVVVREPDGAGIADLDLRGKVALVWAPDGGHLANFRTTWTIANALRRAGAAASAYVDDASCRRYPALTGRGGPSGNRILRGRGRYPNMLYVGTSALRGIAAAAGLDLARIDADAFAVPLRGLRAELQIELQQLDAPAFNVAGILRGADEKLRDEYVVIGSHLDHLGERNGRIFPGADDDASGTTGVLAVARAFVRNPVRPRRSVLFVTFCGEENGLIGSGHFAKNPPIPLSSIVAELQMDMIGRSEEGRGERAEDNLNSLHLIGTKKLSSDLHELCVARNDAHAGFELEWDAEDVFYRSDHWNFARVGVPIAFFFTGFHRDYHKPSDTPDKIDYPKLARVATYVYDVAFELAQRDERPLVDPEKWRSLARKGSAEPAAPMREQR